MDCDRPCCSNSCSNCSSCSGCRKKTQRPTLVSIQSRIGRSGVLDGMQVLHSFVRVGGPSDPLFFCPMLACCCSAPPTKKRLTQAGRVCNGKQTSDARHVETAVARLARASGVKSASNSQQRYKGCILYCTVAPKRKRNSVSKPNRKFGSARQKPFRQLCSSLSGAPNPSLAQFTLAVAANALTTDYTVKISDDAVFSTPCSSEGKLSLPNIYCETGCLQLHRCVCLDALGCRSVRPAVRLAAVQYMSVPILSRKRRRFLVFSWRAVGTESPSRVTRAKVW